MVPSSSSPALGFEVRLASSFDDAIEKVTAALKAEGFGILSRIDVQAAFREKLGAEFRPYAILGACNPPLAHRALSARPEVGLLLPCNVTVEQTAPGDCLVRIIDANGMIRSAGLQNDPVLASVGSEADVRLRKVAAALRT